MTATLFRLHDLIDGHHVAWALVCPGARYVSLVLPTTPHLVRRHLDVKAWLSIEHELSCGLNPGPLPADGEIAKSLTPRDSKAIIVQYVTVREIGDTDPSQVPGDLDEFLKASAQDL